MIVSMAAFSYCGISRKQAIVVLSFENILNVKVNYISNHMHFIV